jgi:hypothetical protein
MIQVAKTLDDVTVRTMFVQDQREHSTKTKGGAQVPIFDETLLRSLAFKKMGDVWKVCTQTRLELMGFCYYT